MKTTLDLDDTLMRRLKEEAARRNTTMCALVEAALRLILDGDEEALERSRTLPPLPSWSGGKPRVDVADGEALNALMDAEGCHPPGETRGAAGL